MKDENKEQFLLNEFATMSIMAALSTRDSTNPIYKKNLSKEDKTRITEFNEFTRNKLLKYSQQYKKPISEIRHIKNIEKLSTDITKKYRDILHRNKFRIGITQKLLNLYLKYLWSIDKIPMPPHCPFDKNIISKMNILNINWTSLNNIKDYKLLVKQAKKHAGTKSLAEWELEIWNTKR